MNHVSNEEQESTTTNADKKHGKNSPTISVAEESPMVIEGGTELSEAIMGMIKPAVERMDEQVKNTRKSQLCLANHIEQLSSKLKSIVDEQLLPCDLEVYVRKLDDSRKRINGVNQRFQDLHTRMTQLQRGIARETFKVKHKQQQHQNHTQS